MKKFLTIFFVSLGVFFFCIILVLAYLWIADPYNIKPFIYNTNMTKVENEVGIVNNDSPASTDFGSAATPATSTEGITAGTTNTKGGITEGQKNALQLVGIDPAVLPKNLTPEQEQCFVSNFGQARVNAIKAGALPTPMEVLTGKNCLEKKQKVI